MKWVAYGPLQNAGCHARVRAPQGDPLMTWGLMSCDALITTPDVISPVTLAMAGDDYGLLLSPAA